MFFVFFLLFQEVYRDFSVELSSPNNDKDGVDEDKYEDENSKEDDNDGINNKSNINVNSNDNNIHNNNNTNDKGNSKDNQSNSIDSEVNDVIILPNTPEGKMIPISQYLCNTQDKEKMKTNENLHEYGDEHEKSHKKRENLDECRYKKKPLRLENLLKSFFSEEERDLSCDQCKDPKARAKVSNRFINFLAGGTVKGTGRGRGSERGK